MGCWNGTCGISQLPILMDNTKIKAYILLQNRNKIYGSSTNEPMDYFSPYALPITGIYDSYGSIENVVEDWNSKYLLKHFQELHQVGDVQILNDMAEVNSPDITKFSRIEDVFKCIERGALTLKNKKFGLFFVIEQIHSDLIKYVKLEMNKQEYYQQIYQDLESLMNELSILDKNDKTYSGMMRLLFISPVFWSSSITIGDSIYKQLAFNDNTLDIKDLIERYKDLSYIQQGLRHLRKIWFPQTGAGSQSENFDYYRILNKSMENYISQKEMAEKEGK